MTQWFVTTQEPSRQELLANYLNAKAVKQLYRMLLVDGHGIVKVVDRGNVLEVYVGADLLKKITSVSFVKSTEVQKIEGTVTV